MIQFNYRTAIRKLGQEGKSEAEDTFDMKGLKLLKK